MTIFGTALASLHADANMAEVCSYRRPPEVPIAPAPRIIRTTPTDLVGGLGDAVGARAEGIFVSIRASDLPWSPERNDQVTLNGIIYAVVEIKPDTLGLSFELTLVEY
ncbi:hypothetical protein [Sandarakinorhabdus sp.]|uniref:head-tail joining protein n=1 Tax=Sandarakinorhabdus sp. TaxID=1916663 RepID=UPI003567BAED